MMNTTEQQKREYYRLVVMKPAVETQLLTIPGVFKVSVGLKVTNGLPVHEMCYRVYVENKQPANAIPVGQLIPAEIDGIKTDVNEIAKNVTGAVMEDDRKYRPLTGGSRIFSSKGIGSATLGCFAIDDFTQKVVLLSNYHALMAYGEQKGHQVAQPDFCCDKCCCRCGEIARLERGYWGDRNVDCAIATLTNGQQNNWTNRIIRLGQISCIPVDLYTKDPIDPVTGNTTDVSTGLPYQPVQPGETVFKRGKTSRQSEGIVIDTTAPATIYFMSKNGWVDFLFLNQILIHPKNPNRPFSKKGDSGAVVLNHLNQVIGLHFASNSTGTETFSNPIQDVLKILNITIPDTGTLLSMPITWNEDEDTMQAKQPALLNEVTTMIEQHANGPVLIDAFTTFRHEVMELINHKREVTVAWHRYHGPSFIAHLFEKGKNPAHEIPLAIQGITWQRLLSKMSVVLEKNGTPELATAIEQYTPKALGLINDLFHSINQRFNQQP